MPVHNLLALLAVRHLIKRLREVRDNRLGLSPAWSLVSGVSNLHAALGQSRPQPSNTLQNAPKWGPSALTPALTASDVLLLRPADVILLRR